MRLKRQVSDILSLAGTASMPTLQTAAHREKNLKVALVTGLIPITSDTYILLYLLW